MSDKKTKKTRPRKGKPLALDLFSGCGGLTLGLKQAGFRVLAAIESDATAVETYKANHKGVAVKHTDIRKVSALGLMRELKLRRGRLDLLAGCPPCQGFSVLRTRNGARQNRDRRNNLVREMLRFSRAFRPKVVMMENVPKLKGRAPFLDLCKGLRALGYKVTHGIKDAAEYGVPQRRRRLILLAGNRFDIPFAPPAENRRTVRKAIGRLAKAGASGDALHDIPEKKRIPKIMKLIRDIPKNGGSRTDLPKNRQLKCHKKREGFYDIYGRMTWDNVAPTITSGCFNPSKGRFLHPTENRAITMREAALLQSFPRSYEFDASAGKEVIAQMIGNALPPELIKRQAQQIREAIKSFDRRKLVERE